MSDHYEVDWIEEWRWIPWPQLTTSFIFSDSPGKVVPRSLIDDCLDAEGSLFEGYFTYYILAGWIECDISETEPTSIILRPALLPRVIVSGAIILTLLFSALEWVRPGAVQYGQGLDNVKVLFLVFPFALGFYAWAVLGMTYFQSILRRRAFSRLP